VRRYAAEVARDIWQGLIDGLTLMPNLLDSAADGLDHLLDRLGGLR
jgi:hypothetical protein